MDLLEWVQRRAETPLLLGKAERFESAQPGERRLRGDNIVAFQYL